MWFDSEYGHMKIEKNGESRNRTMQTLTIDFEQRWHWRAVEN